MSDEESLVFIVDVPTKGGPGVGIAEIPVKQLRASLNAATAGLADVLRDLWKVGEFQLNEITIGLEISAEGGVHFIGTSKVGGKGSISLKFAAPKPNM
jgi:hypothetical protein